MPKREIKQSNPRRLASLMKQIRTEVYQCSMRKMAEHLSGAVRFKEGQPLTNISEDVIKSLEHRNINVQYIHIETYANLLGVPAGIFLLVSRLQSETPETVVEVINALSETFIRPFEDRGFIDYNDLIALGQKLEESSLNSYQLPPGHSLPASSNEPLSQVEKLRRIKIRHEKQGTDPLFRTDLWGWVKDKE